MAQQLSPNPSESLKCNLCGSTEGVKVWNPPKVSWQERIVLEDPLVDSPNREEEILCLCPTCFQKQLHQLYTLLF